MEEQPDWRTVIDFSVPDAVQGWRTINDTVMGGMSDSRLEATPGETALFAGRVSLENNGGFASVRSPQDEHDLSDFEGVVMRVRGDGKTYKLGLHADATLDGVIWQASFETQAGTWDEIRVPFGRFVPTYRGRILEAEPPIDRSTIGSFSFLIADKQEGPFALEITWLKAY